MEIVVVRTWHGLIPRGGLRMGREETEAFSLGFSLIIRMSANVIEELEGSRHSASDQTR